MMFRSSLLIFALLTAVAAVEVQQHSAVLAGSHAKLARSKAVGGALRGIAGDANAMDDDNNDDDDDDDSDDDDKETPAPVAVTLDEKEVSSKTAAASIALYHGVKEESDKTAAADDEKKKATEAQEDAEAEAEVAMDAAVRNQKQSEREVKLFKDDESFDAKIAEETKLMTNETQSPALASFLGDLRTEMRQYAMPAYPKYLQGELDEANFKVKQLEKELGTEKVAAKKEAQAVKIDPKEAAKPKKEAAPEAAKAEAAGPAADAKAVAQAAGETWAVSFFANVAMLAVVFGMASAKDQLVSNYTWFLIDQVTAIFLAVMYFNAFDSLLDFHEMGVHSAMWASILHAVVMLAIVLGAAIALRKQQVALAIVCGAGAHIVSFSSIHAAAGAQGHLVGMSYTYSMCVFGIVVLALALGFIGFLVYTSKKRMNLTEEDDFMDKTDDLENDFGAMAFSVVFTMFMRFLITGHHPVDDETEMDHSARERMYMFFYAIACLIVAGFVTTFCAKKAEEPGTYAKKRVLNFFSTVATMNVAWAILYWGEWTFFEALFPGDAIKGRVMFAITMTIAGLCGIYGLSKLKSDAKSSQKTKKVALTALSLVVAWSWELCFDAAVESMCEGVSHPVWWKVGTTLALAAIVVPVYAIYMKPITSKAAEAIGA